MTRDDAVMMVSQQLYRGLSMMFAHWRRWRPKVGFPSSSVGFSTGGSVSELEDLEDAADMELERILEAGWIGMSLAERTCIEMLMGKMPWVWSARPGVMESAIEKLNAQMRKVGLE